MVATAAGTVGAQGIVLHPPLGYVSLKTPSGETSFATILVNDPLEPLLLGSTSLSDWGFNLAFANNRVFVADREGMPSIVDVGLPNYPFELTWMAESPYEPLTAMALDAYQDFVYVANLSGEPLLIYDMSDPTNPHKVGSVAGDDQPSRISIHENLLYMTAFPEDSGVSTRLWVYDLDDPLQPAFLSSLDLGFYKSLTAAPGAVYMPINGRIGVVDMSDPENPFYVGSVNPPGYGISTHVCVSDGMLYASMSQDGVIMYDVSDPTNLVEKGGYDLGSAAETEVHGQYAVTVDGLTGFSVVDISIYENPVVLSSELTPDYPRHVNLDWPLAYITGNEGEVWVYDLSDPEVPEMLGSTAQMVVGGTAAFAGPWLVSPMHDRGLGLTWRACFELTGAGGNLPGSPLAISAYPNPFNPMTTVSYNVDHDALVRLEVFDASGRRVSTLAQGFHSEGQYRVSWDGRNQMGQSQASGVYLLRIEAGDQVSQSKMTLVR